MMVLHYIAKYGNSICLPVCDLTCRSVVTDHKALTAVGQLNETYVSDWSVDGWRQLGYCRKGKLRHRGKSLGADTYIFLYIVHWLWLWKIYLAGSASESQT